MTRRRGDRRAPVTDARARLRSAKPDGPPTPGGALAPPGLWRVGLEVIATALARRGAADGPLAIANVLARWPSLRAALLVVLRRTRGRAFVLAVRAAEDAGQGSRRLRAPPRAPPRHDRPVSLAVSVRIIVRDEHGTGIVAWSARCV